MNGLFEKNLNKNMKNAQQTSALLSYAKSL